MQAISYRNKKFDHLEPFDGLFTQGMVCHETYKDQSNNWISPNEIISEDGKNFFKKENLKEKIIVGPIESMSKSKKNTIEPEKMIERYGADSVRLFILSDSPPEKDIQWSEQGMVASYKFIQKLWTLHQRIKEKLNEEKNLDNKNIKINEFTNQLIQKVTNSLEKFNYNVIVASFHEMHNFMSKSVDSFNNKKELKENYIKILQLLMPLFPHFSSECLEEMGDLKENKWPIVEQKYLKSDSVEIVIQFNGKKKMAINTQPNSKEQEVILLVKESEYFNKHYKDQNIDRSVFVKDRLLNLIIKELK